MKSSNFEQAQIEIEELELSLQEERTKTESLTKELEDLRRERLADFRKMVKSSSRTIVTPQKEERTKINPRDFDFPRR